MGFCNENKKYHIFGEKSSIKTFLSRKRAITTFLSRKFMITRSSIAFVDFLGSSIAPQVMPPWFKVAATADLLVYYEQEFCYVYD